MCRCLKKEHKSFETVILEALCISVNYLTDVDKTEWYCVWYNKTNATQNLLEAYNCGFLYTP